MYVFQHFPSFFIHIFPHLLTSYSLSPNTQYDFSQDKVIWASPTEASPPPPQMAGSSADAQAKRRFANIAASHAPHPSNHHPSNHVPTNGTVSVGPSGTNNASAAAGLGGGGGGGALMFSQHDFRMHNQHSHQELANLLNSNCNASGHSNQDGSKYQGGGQHTSRNGQPNNSERRRGTATSPQLMYEEGEGADDGMNYATQIVPGGIPAVAAVGGGGGPFSVGGHTPASTITFPHHHHHHHHHHHRPSNNKSKRPHLLHKSILRTSSGGVDIGIGGNGGVSTPASALGILPGNNNNNNDGGGHHHLAVGGGDLKMHRHIDYGTVDGITLTTGDGGEGGGSQGVAGVSAVRFAEDTVGGGGDGDGGNDTTTNGKKRKKMLPLLNEIKSLLQQPQCIPEGELSDNVLLYHKPQGGLVANTGFIGVTHAAPAPAAAVEAAVPVPVTTRGGGGGWNEWDSDDDDDDIDDDAILAAVFEVEKHQTTIIAQPSAVEAAVPIQPLQQQQQQLVVAEQLKLDPSTIATTSAVEAAMKENITTNDPQYIPLAGDRENVHHIIEAVFPPDPTIPNSVLTLKLRNKYKGTTIWVYLYDAWGQYPQIYEAGDPVNLIVDSIDWKPEKEGIEGCCCVNEAQGLLVTFPDLLLSCGGDVSEVRAECVRSAVIKYLWDDEAPGGTAAMMAGTLTHELIQDAMVMGKCTISDLKQKTEDLLVDFRPKMRAAGLSEEKARDDISSSLADISHFLEKTLVLPSKMKGGTGSGSGSGRSVVSPPPNPYGRPTNGSVGGGATRQQQQHQQQQLQQNAVLQSPLPEGRVVYNVDQMHPDSSQQAQQAMVISEVIDIEEHISSSKYGLTGKIDASLKVQVGQSQVTLQDPSNSRRVVIQDRQLTEFGEPSIAPMEIKTGKDHNSHEYQLRLYLLLMEEEYVEKIKHGVLWNCNPKNAITKLVTNKHMDLSWLLTKRNLLASALGHRDALSSGGGHRVLPPVTGFKNDACGACYRHADCAIVASAVEGLSKDEFLRMANPTEQLGGYIRNNLVSAWNQYASQLTNQEKYFISFWLRKIHEEERRAIADHPKIWSKRGSEREAAGEHCIAGLKLVHVGSPEGGDDNGGAWTYTFEKADGSSLSAVVILMNELLTLSIEGKHIMILNVNFSHRCDTSLTVMSYKKLRPEHMIFNDDQGLYRVDKKDFVKQFSTLRRNLTRIFTRERPSQNNNNNNQNTRAYGNGRRSSGANLRELIIFANLRRWVVEMEAPDPPPSEQEGGLPEYNPPPGDMMNEEQIYAVRRALCNKSYLLVEGMPGAGKTTAIAAMAAALASQGKKVLLVSPTNAAVDNVLVKLYEKGMNSFLRVGSGANVHPVVREFMQGGQFYPTEGMNQQGFAKMLENVSIFATTCSSCHKEELVGMVFDVCIMEEAGMISLPMALGPLSKANSFILVGDKHQLAPLVRSAENQVDSSGSGGGEEQGMGVSLMSMLQNKHPSAVVRLSLQYRMCADIMQLPNRLVYSDRLKCGNEAVADARLMVQPARLASVQRSWLRRVWDPNCRVVFLSTSKAGLGEQIVGGGNGGGIGGGGGIRAAAVVGGGPSSAPPSNFAASIITMNGNHCTDKPICANKNEGEARVVVELLRCAMNHLNLVDPDPDTAPNSEKPIAVISPYKNQVNLILQCASRSDIPPDSFVCSTVDKSQGTDFDCVILSMVRSNECGEVGSLLADLSRLNVAMTRAKKKLIIVGNHETLSSMPAEDAKTGHLRKLVDMVEQKGWMQELPASFLEE